MYVDISNDRDRCSVFDVSCVARFEVFSVSMFNHCARYRQMTRKKKKDAAFAVARCALS